MQNGLFSHFWANFTKNLEISNHEKGLCIHIFEGHIFGEGNHEIYIHTSSFN